jgi:hypothetical protein
MKRHTMGGKRAMLRESRWTLVVTAALKDGTLFLFEPMSGAHVQVRELVDSDLALLEFTLVVSRAQAQELRDTLTLGGFDRRSSEKLCALLD